MELRYKIVGTEHRLQRLDKQLHALLADAIRLHRVVLIAEEVDANLSDARQQSVGRTLAGENAIPWLSIDMTFAQQQEAGIYERLEYEFKLRQQSVNAYAKDAEDVRENYWLDQIRDECIARGITDGMIIIICGHNHLSFIADKARARGVRTVEAVEHPEGLGASPDNLGRSCFRRDT